MSSSDWIGVLLAAKLFRDVHEGKSVHEDLIIHEGKIVHERKIFT